MFVHWQNWTKQDTDQLFEFCEQFDLRFVIIEDRWASTRAAPRSVEELKLRYYTGKSDCHHSSRFQSREVLARDSPLLCYHCFELKSKKVENKGGN